MRRIMIVAFLLLSVATWAQAPKAVRVGVAVMQNSSTRPFASRGPRDRLVFYLNGIHAKRGQPQVEAVALEATSRAAARLEAERRQCDYIVFTTLVTLQATDPPGKVRVGSDPVLGPSGPPYEHSPVYVGVMSYELTRRGEPLTQSTVKSVQRITADDMIDVLMSEAAKRVRKEIAKHP